MSESSKEEHTNDDHVHSEAYSQDTREQQSDNGHQFDQSQQSNEQNDEDQQFDLQEAYLNRLKVQRIRIQELSYLHKENQQKLKRQLYKNKILEEELQRYKNNCKNKEDQLGILIDQNKYLKDLSQKIKQQLTKISIQKIHQAQRLKTQFSNELQTYRLKICELQEEVNTSQDKMDKMDKMDKEKRQLKKRLKYTITRYQKQHSQHLMMNEQLLQENNEIKQILQYERYRYQVELNRQKIGMQAVINQHLVTIEDLVSIKNQLSEENKRLWNTLKNKQASERQRKAFPRTKIKQNDNLQKVIDKII